MKLPEDMVATDNQRACTLPLVAARRMLLVQGNPDDPLAYFVRSAIDPGGAIRTGWSVDVKGATFLAGASQIDLATYDVVWLLDVPAVDSAISSALRGYVEGGGGLALWCGKGTRVENYNEYLFGNEGLVPGKLLSSTPVKRSGESPLDVLLDQPHPITAPLAAVGAGMFGAVGFAKH